MRHLDYSLSGVRDPRFPAIWEWIVQGYVPGIRGGGPLLVRINDWRWRSIPSTWGRGGAGVC